MSLPAEEPCTTNQFDVSLDVDVLIIGAGFGGIYSLYRLRSLGLKVKCFEASYGMGGVWRWNCYPGARVDVEMPYYSYSIPELWESWLWSERYPGFAELREYFEHAERVLDLKKDIYFRKRVVKAEYDSKARKWTVGTQDGSTATCSFLVTCVGTSARRNYPDFKNFDAYQGPHYHSSFWPEQDVAVDGKTVAIIGSGATGLQIAQEWSKRVQKLIVFVRTPNMAIPMRQKRLDALDQVPNMGIYKVLFDHSKTTRSCMPYARPTNKCFDNTHEEQQAYLEKLWARGGFNFTQGLWSEFLTDDKVNDVVYDFWCRKVRERIPDATKADILAPRRKPHPIGTKRLSQEQDYYEMMSRLTTADGVAYEFDVLALATGYDAVTGGLLDLGIVDKNGVALSKAWEDGVRTHLGLLVPDAPNCFILYGPQSPSGFTNAPVFLETQVDYVAKVIALLRKEGVQSIEAKHAAAEEWRDGIIASDALTLFGNTNSWYNGGNVAGKRKEQLMFLRGNDIYQKFLNEAWERLEDGIEKGETRDFILT